jgi:hypothetical protein
MAPLSFSLVISVAAAAFGFSFVLDLVKVPVFARLKLT